MADTELTIVLAYDVVRDRTRARLAEYLEKRLVRVQRSVFEGRLSHRRALMLFDAACAIVDEDDSIRLYVLTHDGLVKSRAFGGAPLPEEGSFVLM